MGTEVVVDTSLVLKWVLNESDSAKALALLTMWGHEGVKVVALALLAYEVTNSLYQQVRSGNFSLDAARQGLSDVILTGLELHFSPDPTRSARAMELAYQFGLQATYDPHFLALAESKGCELWTADTRLWRAVSGKLGWVRLMSDYQPS
jgi:predicted nucleic acid-binding protein